MKSHINLRLEIYSFMIIFIFLFLISGHLSASINPSNESLQAKELLNKAEKDIYDMVSKNISVLRVNETYQEALQLYSAQMALEERGSKANYSIIIKDASEIASIKDAALEANDELEVFRKNYEQTDKEINLSEMQEEYNQIMISFNEERFEDTLLLIDNGYDKISEIQSSHTAVNAIYLSTSTTIKKFFIKNGLKIAITIAVILILLLIFWNTLKKLNIRIKLNNLIMQKKSISNLIKEMQLNYFKRKIISETEYKTKLNFYNEFIRDIERQIMVLDEEMFKRNNKGQRSF